MKPNKKESTQRECYYHAEKRQIGVIKAIARQEVIDEIKTMIVDEILIAQMEGQPTSRLTSLSTRINKINL